MSKPDKVITLILGDWSHDGHNQSDTVNILSNLSDKDIRKAYKTGTKKLSFDFCEEVASEYEDRKLEAEKWKQLKDLGYQNEPLEEEGEKYNEGDISLWIDSFTDIYLFIVKLGNKDFQFEYMKEDKNPHIKIGGYGLYS